MGKGRLFVFMTVLLLATTELIFCSSWGAMTGRFSCIISQSFPGVGKRVLLLHLRMFLPMGDNVRRADWYLIVAGFLCKSFLCLTPFPINTVAVTVHFLILLFIVNGSYRNPWSMPFVRPLAGEEGNKCRVVLAGLNWKVSFLNHNNEVYCWFE